MKLFSHSFKDGQAIPGKFCFAVKDQDSHLLLSDNLNPHLAWEDVPEGTQSFVLICHDPDVPTSIADVNQEGRIVPATLPRADFHHWLLLDIPRSQSEIEAGSHSQGITPRGKNGPAALDGLRHGINNYTDWFAGDDAMSGTYYGYDGACPPWNDEIVHHYIFTLYALSSPGLEVKGELNVANILDALRSSDILASATLTGLYSLNPNVLI